MPDVSGVIRPMNEIAQNAHSYELAKTDKKLKDARKPLTAINQEPIDASNHVKLFPMPLSIFKKYPVNSMFVEKVYHECIASKPPTSDQFMFTKNKITGELIYLPRCFVL